MDILSALKNGLATVDALLPLAAATGFGGAAVVGAVKIAGALVEIGQNVMDNVETGVVVMNSDDKAQISALLEDLQARNDELAKRVAAS